MPSPYPLIFPATRFFVHFADKTGLTSCNARYLHGMKTMKPVRSLIRLNILLAIVASLSAFVFMSLSTKPMTNILIFSLMALVLLLCMGFVNLAIIVYAPRKPGSGFWGYRMQRYVCSYLYAMLTFITVWPLFAWLADAQCEYTNYKLAINFFANSLLMNTLVILLQNFILLLYEKAAADLENSRLKTANAEAANQLLKTQIHPHLLFNTLNTLKSLYKKDVQAGEVYLLHLANFLRAAISDDATQVKHLSAELRLCSDYMEMQRLRFGSALHYTVAIPDSTVQQGYIPSFSIQPLLENAIQHNEITEEAPLSISIWEKNGWIVVENNIQLKQHKEASTGTGLANLAERYKMLGGEEPAIQQADHVFSVSIKILPHAHSDHRR